MQRDLPELAKRKIGFAAISYDSPAILKEFGARKGITFPLLSDYGSKTIRAYGILNETVKPDSFAYGIPMPGTLVLDRGGRIKAKFAEADYRERMTLASILDHQFNASTSSPMTRVEAKQIALSLGASSSLVTSGQRITLSIEGELAPKMHVYAPGVTGYKPVSWTFDESPGWKMLEAEFPKPEMLHLPVINETVPVYRNRFRIRRDVVVPMPAAVRTLVDSDGNLTVRGTLRYQACDDKECYLPESVRVEWKLHWEAFDSQRANEAIRHK